MKEYIVVENPPNFGGCEKLLNDYAAEGWIMAGFSQYQIVMEREKPNEEQTPEQING